MAPAGFTERESAEKVPASTSVLALERIPTGTSTSLLALERIPTGPSPSG